MATITAAMVKELRARTDVAMMKCKKALEECGGDMEAAVDFLRKTAGAAQDKKSERETKAGGIGLALGAGAGCLVQLACETDFVSGNDQFKAFVTALAEAALAAGVETTEGLQGLTIDDQSFNDALAQQVQKLGENIQPVRVDRLTGEVVTGYNHGGRVATLVGGSGDTGALRSLAMHIAAANPAPLALDRDGIDADLVAKERDIIAESPDVQSKPEQIRPKIIDGKMGRFFKERVLLEQEMLVSNEDGKNVGAWAKGQGLTITGYVRSDV